MGIFQTFWYGGALPEYVRVCLRSFILSGHSLEIYAYEDLAVPNGVILKDAKDIIPENEIFFYKNADGSIRSVAAFSDLFRYELLLQKGNWWVDTDVFCLSSKLPPGEVYFGWQDSDNICNAIMKFPEGSEVSRELVRRSRAKQGDDLAWGEIGPQLVTQVVKDMHIEWMAYPLFYAYPIGYGDYSSIAQKLDRSLVQSKLADVPFLHLWNEMFRLDPNRSLDNPEPGSLWEQLRSDIIHATNDITF